MHALRPRSEQDDHTDQCDRERNQRAEDPQSQSRAAVAEHLRKVDADADAHHRRGDEHRGGALGSLQQLRRQIDGGGQRRRGEESQDETRDQGWPSSSASRALVLAVF